MHSTRWLSRGSMVCLVAGLMLVCSTAFGGENRFLRVVEDNQGGARLETSVMRYVNHDGVTIDLVSAVHIADPGYFRELSVRLEAYDAVLYELVKPAAMVEQAERQRRGEPPAERRGRQSRQDRGGALNMVGSMQQLLKDVLELSFQLDHIDYTKPNFVHADLTAEEFTRLQAERGESIFLMMLRSMLSGVRNPQLIENQPSFEEVLEAMFSPDRPRRLKLLLARQLTQMDAMSELLEGGGGSVILGERNKKAVKVAREQIDAGKRNIAIFYGAAHMKGIEELLEIMGFKPQGEPKWVLAWDMAAR